MSERVSEERSEYVRAVLGKREKKVQERLREKDMAV